jgi:beta-glucosidase
MLPDRALAFYDVTCGAWRVEPGLFRIEVGASSRDIRLSALYEHRGEDVLEEGR